MTEMHLNATNVIYHSLQQRVPCFMQNSNMIVSNIPALTVTTELPIQPI